MSSRPEQINAACAAEASGCLSQCVYHVGRTAELRETLQKQSVFSYILNTSETSKQQGPTLFSL